VRRPVGVLASSLLAAAWLSCGARTGLPGGNTVQRDGGIDAVGGRTGLVDSSIEDAPSDVHDARPDAPQDAARDAPLDSPVVTSCADAGLTYIYLVTDDRELLSFYPPTASFTSIGRIACPVAATALPFSMGVDHAGMAYVLFDNGELFQVSTLDASCQATGFRAGQRGFQTFGMGFSSNQNAPGETLYVDQIDYTGGTPSIGLGTIDLQTYELSYIGPFDDPTNVGGELTGNGESQLFLYFFDASSTGGTLAQIDRQSGGTLSSVALPVGNSQSSLAFAFWGGQFYIFTTPGVSPTTVTRYSPIDGSLVVVARRDGRITGAGVSTCAPQH
jgi:hypothetical protein